MSLIFIFHFDFGSFQCTPCHRESVSCNSFNSVKVEEKEVFYLNPITSVFQGSVYQGYGSHKLFLPSSRHIVFFYPCILLLSLLLHFQSISFRIFSQNSIIELKIHNKRLLSSLQNYNAMQHIKI